jgi:O-methyltransferase
LKREHLIRSAIRTLGFDIIRYGSPSDEAHKFPDLSLQEREVLRQVAGFTMTSIERQVALVQAVRYIVNQGIDGCFVECGVWRGSSMAIALTLSQEGQSNRDLYLYDTFEGMSTPTTVDRSVDGISAQTHLERDVNKINHWCVAGIDDVRSNMDSTGNPKDHIQIIKGPVETTLPSHAPKNQIALLRLDADWYESTRHELIHLFPLMSEGGVLIIDDYGHWEGARKAFDEYFGDLPRKFYLHRIDYTGRLLVKR